MPECQHILIVDDDPTVLLILNAALAKLGDAYRITTAGDARDALDKAKIQAFDLVVSDIRMPGIDGIQLAHRIRDLNRSTAIIWITAYGCEDLQAAGERLQVSGCLAKPLRISEIRRVVLAALEKQECHNQSPIEKRSG